LVVTVPIFARSSPSAEQTKAANIVDGNPYHASTKV
jgi:hypothetical protein